MVKVYILTDERGCVTSIDSDDFVEEARIEAEGWLLIDEGEGDRYTLAQGNYLPLPLVVMDERGTVYRYRYDAAAREVVERSEAEIEMDFDALPPLPPDYQAMQPDVLMAVRTLLPQVVAEEDMALHMGLYPHWQPGFVYRKGEVLQHEGVLYQVQQDVTSQAHQPPGSGGMLAIYRPFQGQSSPGEVLPWVEGEAVQFGDRRAYEDAVYLCIGPGGAGANVWPPPTAPAIWERVVET